MQLNLDDLKSSTEIKTEKKYSEYEQLNVADYYNERIMGDSLFLYNLKEKTSQNGKTYYSTGLVLTNETNNTQITINFNIWENQYSVDDEGYEIVKLPSASPLMKILGKLFGESVKNQTLRFEKIQDLVKHVNHIDMVVLPNDKGYVDTITVFELNIE